MDSGICDSNLAALMFSYRASSSMFFFKKSLTGFFSLTYDF